MTLKSRLATLLASMVTAACIAVGDATSAAAGGVEARPFCGQYWGSLEKASDRPLSYATLEKVRVGRHDCYDRMVIDVNGPVGGYLVLYDPEHTMFSSSSPDFYPRGGAYLVIWVKNAVVPRAFPSQGTTAVESPDEAADVTGFRTFRQIKEVIYGGLGEDSRVGDLLALGVRARLPFRVFTLDGPGSQARLVIDVAHRW